MGGDELRAAARHRRANRLAAAEDVDEAAVDCVDDGAAGRHIEGAAGIDNDARAGLAGADSERLAGKDRLAHALRSPRSTQWRGAEVESIVSRVSASG